MNAVPLPLCEVIDLDQERAHWHGVLESTSALQRPHAMNVCWPLLVRGYSWYLRNPRRSCGALLSELQAAVGDSRLLLSGQEIAELTSLLVDRLAALSRKKTTGSVRTPASRSGPLTTPLTSTSCAVAWRVHKTNSLD